MNIRLSVKTAIILTAILNSAVSFGQVITGQIVNYQDSSPTPYLTFGDGTHSVTLNWSVADPSKSGYFYSTADTQVAVATGISSINQITDASTFSFTTGHTNPIIDFSATGGVGSFVILKNTISGYFGVVRVDDIFPYTTPINHGTYNSYAGLNATWYFQSNGSANFSAIPEPSTYAIVTGTATLGIAIFRKAKNKRQLSAENQCSS